MNDINKTTALLLFGQFKMEDMSDLELRLTCYLLIYIFASPRHWNYVLVDDLIRGSEYFHNDGSRRLITNGSGIPKHQINKAIALVNKRKLILINMKDDNLMIAKLNLKYLRNESEKISKTFREMS